MVKHLEGHDAPDEVKAWVSAALVAAAEGIGGLEEVHDIRVRETPEELVVVYHCLFAANLSVAAVHDAVHEVERRMKSKQSNLARIIGHAEPAPKAEATIGAGAVKT